MMRARENKQTPTPTICIHLSTIYGRRILVVDRLGPVSSRLDKQIITARARERVGEMELYLFIHFTSTVKIWCNPVDSLFPLFGLEQTAILQCPPAAPTLLFKDLFYIS